MVQVQSLALFTELILIRNRSPLFNVTGDTRAVLPVFVPNAIDTVPNVLHDEPVLDEYSINTSNEPVVGAVLHTIYKLSAMQLSTT